MTQDLRRLARGALPLVALAVLLGAIFALRPNAMSYLGLNLLLNLAIPIVFATLAQMCVLTIGDLDLSIGGFVSFVACVAATYLAEQPALGVLILLGGVAGYGLVGTLVHVRGLPAIVVTLGMSFVWFGLAILVLPSPGGASPPWLVDIVKYKPPWIPMPVIAGAVVAALFYVLMMRTSFGVVLRGAGGNLRAIERAGWSALRARVTLYLLAGGLGVLSGLTLAGLTTSADANIAIRYTLLSIAGAILGGSEFTGGRINPVGAVIGAMVMNLAASFLTFLRIDPDWQIGAQGAILILILVLRAGLDRLGRAR